MSEGLSRIHQNIFEERRTLGCTVYPTTPAGGYALTQENFPGLLEGFIADGISGNNLVGVLGHVTLICTGGWTKPATNQFRRAAGTLSTSGTWPAIGTKNALLVRTGLFPSAGDAIADNVQFGSGTGTKLSTGTSNTNSLAQLTSSSNLATCSPPTLTATTKAVAIKLDQSTANGHSYTHFVGTDDSVEGPVIESSLAGDVSGTWPAFATGASTAVITVQTAPRYLTGIWLLAFNDFPNDILITDAIKWMADNPKKLYPGFYNRS